MHLPYFTKYVKIFDLCVILNYSHSIQYFQNNIMKNQLIIVIFVNISKILRLFTVYNRYLYIEYEQFFDCSTERCYMGGNPQIRAIPARICTPLLWRLGIWEN